MSFRLKIILGIAALQAVLLLILIVSSMNFLRLSNEEALQKRAYTTTRLFAAATRDAVLATDLAALESTAAALAAIPGVVYARVSGNERTLARAGDAGALARPFRADGSIDEIDDGVFDSGGEIRIRDALYGRVEIGFSVAAIQATLLEARTSAVAIAAVGMLLVALFSYFLGLYLTRNLDALREGARRLASGELGYQIEARGGDELAHTARTFNGMSQNLRTAAEERRRAETELTLYKEHLERLVAERTGELTRANEALKATNRQLEEAHNQLLQSEKMASIGQLAAGVAHEINNPVGFVISNMGSLEQYLHGLMRVIDAYEGSEALLAPDGGSLEAIRSVKAAVELDYVRGDVFSLLAESNDGLERVKKIVQDLKDFSRVGEAEWQVADLHQCLDSTLNIVASELKYKAEVAKDYGRLPEVECVPAELNQVFMNLLVNAAQAIAERGRIVLRTGTENDAAWVEIADTGAGIPPEILSRIFDPFFTTKPVGVGTGLGLSLSYGIVQKHHGRIEVSSTPGQGTCFRVSLPLRQPGRQSC